jgi:hypothetical protein
MDAIELTEKIKPHGVRICKLANGGCKTSSNVISLHKMLVARPEQCALTLCESAFNEWLDIYGDSDDK